MNSTILTGDALRMLRTLPDGIAQTCVTSPPYYGLRDYGVEGQMGQEETLRKFVRRLVTVFRQVHRVLRDDGTLWLNLGDSYTGGGKGGQSEKMKREHWSPKYPATSRKGRCLAPKNLMLVPFRVAEALQRDGWHLRCDIIWAKPNPMPESVTDRPTRSHEYLFLLSKSPRYYYDAYAIREPYSAKTLTTFGSAFIPQQNDDGGFVKSANWNGSMAVRKPKEWRQDKQRGHSRRHEGFNARWDAMTKEEQQASGANRRSVWTIAPRPYPEAHFATFPPELPELCIKAGSREGDIVLDPFLGSGTTAFVARAAGRRYIGIELNPAYVKLAEKRLRQQTLPLLPHA